MAIEDMEISSLVPHRGKMLLISRVKNYNREEKSLCAECQITKDCLFYDPLIKAVPAWVGFEFIAQAISALSGVIIRERGEEPKIGLIMSVSSMNIGLPSFACGNILEIKVKEMGSIDVVYTFKGEIFLEGKKIVEGKLTVVDASDEQLEALKREVTTID